MKVLYDGIKLKEGVEINDVAGYEGRYFITSDGQVFSYRYFKRKKHYVLLKPHRLKTGYLKTALSDKDGNIKSFSIHRLVAQAFIPNPENKPEVNHIDGNKANNDVSNLEWCTPSENLLHSIHVLGINRNTEKAKKAHREVGKRYRKLDYETAQEIRREHIPGKYGCVRMARKYNVSPSTITEILNGKSYLER